jgi:siderophore synthetase component
MGIYRLVATTKLATEFISMTIASLHINQQQWQLAGTRLIEMAIAEFLYEEILQAKAIDGQTYQLSLGEHQYQFKGYQYQLGHWQVTENSVREYANQEVAWDLNRFIVAVARHVEVKPFTLAYLIKEMNNTWLAEAHLLNTERPSSDAILDLSASEVEGVLRGHPWLVMSKGRMGFSYQDYLNFAPEMQPKLQLLWVAVHRDLAQYRAVDELPENTLYDTELDEAQRQQFDQKIAALGKNKQDYIGLLVHPWQWHHWIISNFAGEIVQRRIIELGLSHDWYTPMQSIRTFSNISKPSRHYVKLPLSIFNTAVYRGLPSDRNLAAPALTQWLKQTYQQDQQWQDTGIILLGEMATVTVGQPCFDQVEGAPYQFKELFGCLWRESVQPYLNNNQQVLTQAALVHRDLNGKSVLAAMVKRSGLEPLVWLKQFVHVCLTPLLYSLYRYGLVFSPHGENSLLVHENGVPKRMVIKDFIDDVNVVEEDFPELGSLPPETALLIKHPARDLTHFIFTGLFIVHYRYISSIFMADFQFSEADFWQQVADVVYEFHAEHPEFAERIEKFAIQREQFEKICLNRVRLFSHGYADDAERPVPTILPPMNNPINAAVIEQWRANTTQQDVAFNEEITHA